MYQTQHNPSGGENSHTGLFALAQVCGFWALVALVADLAVAL